MYDVVALGELLVDFIQNGSSQNGKNPLFEALHIIRTGKSVGTPF